MKDLAVSVIDFCYSSSENPAIRLFVSLEGFTPARVPCRLQAARRRNATGPGAIRREAGTRRIAVEASVAGRDLGSTAEDVRAQLTKSLQLPTAYFFDLAGKVESQKRASRSLAIAIAPPGGRVI